MIACSHDCGGVSFTVKGYVLDSSERPLAGAAIRMWNQGSFELPPFEVTALSDETGYFETESAYSYACTPFTVEISSLGYVSQTLRYAPPYEGFADELPDEITIQLQPIGD